MTTQELYSKGTPVWVPSEETVWQMATLATSYAGEATLDVRLENGTTKTVKISSEKDLPPLRNPDMFSGLSDLTQLSYLHEPAVLHNLKVRFTEQSTIYTYCGIVLVAINPYESLPIYDQNNMETYRGSAMGELDPHIFAIAEEAHAKMERENKDQAIIVSGESGAGKTVSARYAMRYFASASGSSTETNVEKRVLATNPIMEAIGNAKTTRNDNSSRFGKFIEIDFDKHFNITGAKMRTYLLEKSRVVFQSSQERNYHIFYQLCAAAEELPDLKLGSADEFRYTNLGGNIVIDGVNDYSDFFYTCEALDLLAFPKSDQNVMFRILAAVLHLGDISFVALDQDTSAVRADDKHLAVFAQLLGINASQMSMWLTKRKLVTAREQMTKPLRLQEAEAGRDAFAKHIYSRLFNWVVAHMNKKLIPERQPHRFIGVLDIYGFETFERNSFEQFCINYANEKLQQQFVIHVFKLEQDEYKREEIEWTMIDFSDNQPCIDLIEGRLGILDLLDEECKVPKGSDQTWVQKMIVTAKDREKAGEKAWKCFEKPRFSNESFIVIHFADKVEYDCDGFLDKNRDTMNEEFVNLLRASEFHLVAQLFADSGESITAGKSDKGLLNAKPTPVKQPPTMGTHKMTTQSVGSQFQDSLKALMTTLNKTTPHYVRCIKPNDQKKAFEFDPKRAIQQLRACGVLETVRISAAGYPSRWTYKDFFLRYRVMCRSREVDRKNYRRTVENIVTKLIADPDKYKLGKTMIFFRAGQVAYMEKLRSDKRNAAVLMIQKSFRGWLARRKYIQIRRTVIKIQTMARGFLARRHYKHLRETAAAVKIQAAVRGFIQRRRYRKLRSTITAVQAVARGCFARSRYVEALHNRKAVIIQKHVRGWLARRRYQKTIKKIILVQCCIRRYLAKKELRVLKIEARNVEHVKQLNKGLENKIINLQQKVDELNGELHTRRKMDEEVRELRNKAATAKQLDHEIQQKSIQVQNVERTLEEVRRELAQERKHAETVTAEVAHYKHLLSTREAALSEIAGRHGDEMQRLRLENQALHEISKNQSDVLSKEFEERIDSLQREVAEERENRQRAIDDLDRMKQRYANLEDQIRVEGTGRSTRSHNRSPSDVSTGSVASLDSVSTGALPEVGDDGYSTQRSKNTGRRPPSEWGGNFDGDTASREKITSPPKGLSEELLDLPVGSDTDLDAEKLEALRIENQTLKHELEVRPPLDECISEKIRRQLEENLALRRCVAQCLEGLEGKLPPDHRTDLVTTLRHLTELKPDDLISKVPNVVVEDVSGLDGVSLNQLFLSLREALAIQATETSRLISGRSHLSNEHVALIKENQLLKTLVNKVTKADNARNGINELVTGTTHVMVQNEGLLKENKDLRRKVRSLEKALYSERGPPQHHMLNGRNNDDDTSSISITKKGDYQGMIEYPLDQTETFVHAIAGISPALASSLNLPGLPAYLLFMAARYTDHMDNERAVKQLLSATKTELEGILKRKKESIEHFAMWLLNGLRLVDLLKQYSGDEKFQKDNSVKQNQHCLKLFDLSVFRQHFDDLCVSIYRSLVVLMQREIKDDAAKAIIEHECVLGLKPPGTLTRKWKTKNPAECFNTVQRKLEQFFKLVTLEHALDPMLVRQIFRQLLYCLSCHSVNFLMQSQKTCTFVIGIQIRANISNIQEWVRTHSHTLYPDEVMMGMAAITECAHILQARKQKDEDIDSIISMSKAMSNAQILKLLQNYVPSEDFDKVTPDFMKKMQERLKERPEPSAPGLPGHLPSKEGTPTTSFTLSTDYVYPVVFPYSPSKVELDSIQIPADLGLSFARKI